jgi:hypothetical protein
LAEPTRADSPEKAVSPVNNETALLAKARAAEILCPVEARGLHLYACAGKAHHNGVSKLDSMLAFQRSGDEPVGISMYIHNEQQDGRPSLPMYN